MKQILNSWLKINQLLDFKSFKHLFLTQKYFNLNFIKQTLFAQNCTLCAGNFNNYLSKILNCARSLSQYAICHACIKSLPWLNTSHCPQCGLTSDEGLCGSCINSTPHFDATHAVFSYEFPINVMMQRYKYGNMLSLSTLFGQLLNDKIKQETIDLIIPMPMHPQRLKIRGFNQALEIARFLNTNSRNKLDYTSVIRQSLTPPQASLPLKARVNNIKGAFDVIGDVRGKKIAIVDDVMTSGASLNELAKTLKKAGAVHVECWVIARTMPH